MHAPNTPILIIDDTDDDLFFVRRLLVLAGIKNEVVERNSVRAAKEYLERVSSSGATAQPCIVLCDVKMPGETGFDFLSWVQASDRLNRLPVVMMSQSTLAADRMRAQSLGAKDYIAKYPTPQSLRDTLQALSVDVVFS